MQRFGTLNLRHLDAITAVQFSPDGKLLVSSSRDGAIHFWDTHTGEQRARSDGPPVGTIMAVDPRGRFLATGAAASPIELWKLDSGAPVREVGQAPEGGTAAIVFSPDGRRLAASSGQRRVTVYDVDSPRTLLALGAASGDPAGPVPLAFAPTGLRLAYAQDRLHIDALEPRALLRTLDPAVSSIAFGAGGNWVAFAAGGAETIVKVVDVRTGHLVASRKAPGGGSTPLAFSPGRNVLAMGGADGAVHRWDLDRLADETVLGDLAGYFTSLAYSPDGKLLAAGTSDSVVALWDTTTATRLIPDGLEGVPAIAVTTGGKQVLTGSGRTVRLWDSSTSHELRRFTASRPITAVAFSPDGKLLAYAGESAAGATVEVRRTDTGQSTLSIPGHSRVAFSPDSRHIAYLAGTSSRLEICDVNTGQMTAVIAGRFEPGSAGIAFSPDGRFLAAIDYATEDSNVRICDVTGSLAPRVLHLPAGSERPFLCLAFSPDGRNLATADEAVTLVWDTQTLKVSHHFEFGPDDRVDRLAFTGDGLHLAVACGDIVHLRNIKTGKDACILRPGGGRVHDLAISPDGRWLASAGGDTTVLLFDVNQPDKIDPESRLEPDPSDPDSAADTERMDRHEPKARRHRRRRR